MGHPEGSLLERRQQHATFETGQKTQNSTKLRARAESKV